ncbi:MAG: hypothetical protein HQL87_09455 [Magnetococcales bacterium]|nr:hypothetical protein [Magnetococcales bacterium]
MDNTCLDGPVFSTERGRPRKLADGHTRIADLLAMPGVEEIELAIPPVRTLAQPAELT